MRPFSLSFAPARLSLRVWAAQFQGIGHRFSHNCPELVNGTWEGIYYTDYPVEVTAIPDQGYHFVGWSGDLSVSDESIEVYLKEGGMKIAAVFEKDK